MKSVWVVSARKQLLQHLYIPNRRGLFIIYHHRDLSKLGPNTDAIVAKEFGGVTHKHGYIVCLQNMEGIYVPASVHCFNIVHVRNRPMIHNIFLRSSIGAQLLIGRSSFIPKSWSHVSDRYHCLVGRCG